jgi:predicted  nucleic acid-binding Zn-ribbon protein
VANVVLDIIGCAVSAAAIAWGITRSWASAVLAHTRAAMQDEIDHWQAEAMRARRMVAQLRQEAVAWSRGRQDGREDLIAMVPLIVAAQQRLGSETENLDADC